MNRRNILVSIAVAAFLGYSANRMLDDNVSEFSTEVPKVSKVFLESRFNECMNSSDQILINNKPAGNPIKFMGNSNWHYNARQIDCKYSDDGQWIRKLENEHFYCVNSKYDLYNAKPIKINGKSSRDRYFYPYVVSGDSIPGSDINLNQAQIDKIFKNCLGSGDIELPFDKVSSEI